MIANLEGKIRRSPHAAYHVLRPYVAQRVLQQVVNKFSCVVLGGSLNKEGPVAHFRRSSTFFTRTICIV